MELNSVITSDLGKNRLMIDPDYIQLLFKPMCPMKSSGPDGISAFLLKVCAEELTPDWCYIFQ